MTPSTPEHDDTDGGEALARSREALDEAREAAREALDEPAEGGDLDAPGTGDGLESDEPDVAPRPN